MIQKEEDTVMLLSPVDVEEDTQKNGKTPPRRSFTVSGISSSFTCGAGIFVANTIVWCRDPGEACKDSEIFRVTALLGGIISSLIVGRAVDCYGRRSSLMFSVLFGLFATGFLFFLPSQNQMNVNFYDAPLSKYYIWPTEPRFSSVKIPPMHDINTYDPKISLSQLLSYSYFQNSSHSNHLFPTKPTPINPVSVHGHGSHLHSTPTANGSLSNKSLSSSKNNMFEYSNLKPVSSMTSLSRSSFLIPVLSFYLFLGAASAASIVAISVYVYETSPSDSRARWLSLSEFFSSLCILSLPVLSRHLLVLATITWLPIITLGFLLIIPFHIPNYLSLPHSPHFLLLTTFMQRRNSLFSNSVITLSNESKGVILSKKDNKNEQLRSVFQTYGKTALGHIKIPFKKAKIKIHDSSSKSSASDSDESICFFNDKRKHLVLESDNENLQSVSVENEEDTNSVYCGQSEMAFPKVISPYSCAALVENITAADKNICMDTKLLGELEESVSSVKCAAEECEEESGMQENLEPNGTHDGCETLEECATLVQQGWSDSSNPGFSWQERESLRILSHLNGKKKGLMEWENIRKLLKEEAFEMKYSAKKTFFHFDIPSFCSTLHLVFKVGVPLVIIHMLSCEYGAVVILSETILPKLGFCNLSGPATVTSLQVVSSGTSVLVLDKLRNQMVLKSAAVVMTSSLIILGFLLPSLQNTVDEQLSVSKDSVTPNPALPTLYPLLPTPLPQSMRDKGNMCFNTLFESSPSTTWDGDGIAHDNLKNIPSNSPFIWFSAFVLLVYVVISALVVLPLTRFVLVSYFPIHKRGSGVGISISIEWILRLIMIFFPCSFFNSGIALSLYAAALLSSILFLCAVSPHFFPNDDLYRVINDKNKSSHLFSKGKIGNVSEINSTAV